MLKRNTKAIIYFFKYIYHKSILRSDKGNDILYEAADTLGGVYIKLLQFVSLRTSLFSNSEKVRFLSFYDQVSQSLIDINQVLLKELGEELVKQNFKTTSLKPFATGSFGQVYQATLNNGEEVVIKVQKEGLKQKLKSDFFLLRIIAFVFNLIYNPKLVNINQLVKEFGQTTYQELDYISEAKNAEYFYEYYKNHEVIKIPKTYKNLSTKNILVQERVEGIPLTQIIKMKTENSDYRQWLIENYNTDIRQVSESVFFELVLQAIKLSKFFADPHPGNIIVLEDNRIAFIDFGIAANAPKDKRNYYQLLKLLNEKTDEYNTQKIGEEMLMFGSQKLYESFKALGKITKLKPLETLTNNYKELIDEKKDRFKQIESKGQQDFTSVVIDIMESGEMFNVKLPDNMFNTLKSSAIFKSFALYLEPDFHCTRKVYSRVLETVSENELLNESNLQKQPITSEKAVENIVEWLSGIAEKDYTLYNKINKILFQPSSV